MLVSVKESEKLVNLGNVTCVTKKDFEHDDRPYGLRFYLNTEESDYLAWDFETEARRDEVFDKLIGGTL
jgi:hypothetical protein